MPAELPQGAIERAEAAIAFAQQVRRYHRRRGFVPTRQADIERALGRLKEAMAPLRSEIGRFPYGPQTSLAEENRRTIRIASEALQRERRKLHKMKQRTHAQPD